MKAVINEMKTLIESDDRQQMTDYLLTHRPQSRDEMEMYEILREMEYYLRKDPMKEKEITRRLLNGLRRRTDKLL